jgi:Family of unknown function (DUF6152)
MKRTLVCALLATASLVAARPVIAHHSFAAQYDRNKPVTLTGPVTKLEWMNPHIYFYMDVKDAAGKITNWAIEGGAPNTLYRAGWRKDSVKIGEVVTVHGYLARDGSQLANLATAVLADGRNLYNGQQEGRPPGR